MQGDNRLLFIHFELIHCPGVLALQVNRCERGKQLVFLESFFKASTEYHLRFQAGKSLLQNFNWNFSSADFIRLRCVLQGCQRLDLF
jgi:hypothetical protein